MVGVEELHSSTFGNAAIVWAMDRMAELLERQNRIIKTYLVTWQANNEGLALPGDIWGLIASHIDDHITLGTLEQVCKSAAQMVNWKTLVLKCWAEEDLQEHRDEMAGPYPNWKKIFSAIYARYAHRTFYKCSHCGGSHLLMDNEEWQKYDAKRLQEGVEESHAYFCVCPYCDTGSWSMCQHYANRFPNTQDLTPPPVQTRTCLMQ